MAILLTKQDHKVGEQWYDLLDTEPSSVNYGMVVRVQRSIIIMVLASQQGDVVIAVTHIQGQNMGSNNWPQSNPSAALVNVRFLIWQMNS